jgi:uncharacterized membrane protein
MNQQAPAPLVWWLIWATITAAFFAAVGIFETTGIRTGSPPWTALVVLPLFIASAFIRFGLLPRVTAPPKKFLFFILGLAFAESGGFLALVLGSAWKTPLAAAALVLMILHVPAFIRRD